VFKGSESGNSWERVFVFSGDEEKNGDGQEPLDDQDKGAVSSRIHSIALERKKDGSIYLGTSRGVYCSTDSGTTWSLMSRYGLFGKEVRCVFVSQEGSLSAATESGVFAFCDSRWKEVSFLLHSGQAHALATDSCMALYAACDKGLFRMQVRVPKNNGVVSCDFYSNGEPEIRKVQEVAIKYAEVDPQKISRWRKQAGRKAFFPKITAGVSRDTSDLWHWETGSSTKNGDDVLVRGKEVVGWDVNVSWDLGEIIWNNDQTSIDVRSRLLVELRNDILDEVTKTYFERLRVKMELDTVAIEDARKRTEKLLRLRELTAALDALTGGYFSLNIGKEG